MQGRGKETGRSGRTGAERGSLCLSTLLWAESNQDHFGDPESPHPACSPLAVPPVQQSICDGRAGAGPCSCSAAERGPTGPVLLPAFTCSPRCPHAEVFVPRPVLLPPLSHPIPPAGPAPSDPRGPRCRWGRAGAAQLSPASLNFKAALVCRATESFPSYIQTIGPDPAVAGKQ